MIGRLKRWHDFGRQNNAIMHMKSEDVEVSTREDRIVTDRALSPGGPRYQGVVTSG